MPQFVKPLLVSLTIAVGLGYFISWVFSSHHRTGISQPVWSPNGQSLLFTGGSKLYKINADGTGLALMAVAPRGGNFFDPPSWSSDGKIVAFLIRFDSGNDEIGSVNTSAFPSLNVVESEGSRFTQIGQKVQSYQWTTDRRIVFVTEPADSNLPRRLYQSSEAVLLPTPLQPLEALYQKGDFYYPHWSSSGRRVAFSSRQGITVVNTDGSNPIQFSQGKDASISSWSPDDRLMIYQDQSEENGNTWLINTDGSDKPKRINQEVDQYDIWSPNSRHILHQSGTSANPRSLGLWVIDSQNPNRSKKLVEGRSGVWSPDSRQIAFICRQNQTSDLESICVINVDGTGLNFLGHKANSVAWSPNGKKLSFIEKTNVIYGQLTVINTDGSEMHRLSEEEWWQFCIASICF